MFIGVYVDLESEHPLANLICPLTPNGQDTDRFDEQINWDVDLENELWSGNLEWPEAVKI